MDFLSNLFFEMSGVTLLFFFGLAIFRICLEIVGFNFRQLPMSKALEKRAGYQAVYNFHRTGFYLSLGFIFFSALELFQFYF